MNNKVRAPLSPQVQHLSSLELKRALVRQLVAAAINAFRTTFSSTVSADENYVLKPVPSSYEAYDYVAYVDVLAHGYRVGIRLCVSRQPLEELTRRVVGDITLNQELLESIPTELLNLIYGRAKSFLNDEMNLSFPPAIPRLALKDRFRFVSRGELADITAVPMVTPLGSIDMEVELSSAE